MSDLKELQRNWDELAQLDPLYAILTHPGKEGNRWDLDEFFETGTREVALVMNYVTSLPVQIQRRKALDFGCGIGRLTQAFADYFDEVNGVDIAPTMIRLAQKYNRRGGRCRYYLNEANDLKLFKDNSFDFVYSCITLQHVEPQYSRNYIKEFLRVLNPDGLLLFQITGEPVQVEPAGVLTANRPTRNLKEFVKSMTPRPMLEVYRQVRGTRQAEHAQRPIQEMYGIQSEQVLQLLDENGGKIIDLDDDRVTAPGWTSVRYCVTKRTG